MMAVWEIHDLKSAWEHTAESSNVFRVGLQIIE
jgi:hypothetical protein